MVNALTLNQGTPDTVDWPLVQSNRSQKCDRLPAKINREQIPVDPEPGTVTNRISPNDPVSNTERPEHGD